MKLVKLSDIENNTVLVDPSRVEMIREYVTHQQNTDEESPSQGVVLVKVVLIKVGDVSLPISGTLDEILKKLNISVKE